MSRYTMNWLTRLLCLCLYTRYHIVVRIQHTRCTTSLPPEAGNPLVGQGAHYVGQLSQLLYKKKLKKVGVGLKGKV